MGNALLVIDVQEAFINEATKNIPKRIKKFIESHNFDFVYFFKFLNKKDSNWAKVLGWNEMLDLSEADIVPELKGFLKRDSVFVKQASFSVFSVNKFSSILKKNKINKLFICGFDSDACVLISAMDAFAMGYEVRVIEDLCAASHGKKYHEMAIEILKSNLSKNTVIKSKDLQENKF